MSVIIRLQNLPWSANALDIRQFFQGLSIPEGGVHIVGGELGDAFIAFSTDEDARQAFNRNGGKIKEIQIKLMLSSRTEMQKVIEAARNPLAAFMQASQPAPIIPPLVPTPVPTAVPEVKKDEPKEKDKDKDRKSSSRRKSRSRSRDRKDRSRDRDRRDRRRRDKSRSRSRDRRDRRRKDRSRSRDRTRSKDRDRKSKDRKRSEEKGSSFGNNVTAPIGVWEPPPTNLDQPSLIMANQQHAVGLLNNLVGTSLEELRRNITALKPLATLNDKPDFQNQNNLNLNRNRDSWPPNNSTFRPDNRLNFNMQNRGTEDDINMIGNKPYNNNRMEGNGPQSRNFLNRQINNKYNKNERPGLLDRPVTLPTQNTQNLQNSQNSCVQLHPFYGGYSDIRRFFQGLFINNTGIKFVNDDYGKRTGIVYIRFFYAEDKEIALTKNGGMLKGQMVEVKHVDDEVFNETIDRYYPDDQKEGETGIAGSQSQNFRVGRNGRSFTRNPPSQQTSFIPTPKVFTCLVVEDLPNYAKEQDILKMFGEYPLMSILIVNQHKMNKAYVKFNNSEDAKKAFNEKKVQAFDGKPIKIRACSDEEFSKINGDQNEDETAENEEEVQDGDEKDMPLIESTCICITGLPLKTTDRDIVDFFSDIGVTPEKIHLLNNHMGFSGTAYCEFSTLQDASAAIEKDGIPLGPKEVSISSVSKEEMESRLGVLAQNMPHPGPILHPPVPHFFPRNNFMPRGHGGMGPRGPMRRFHPPHLLPPMQHSGDVGIPGCTVLMENVPYKAGLDEILQFFEGFDIPPDNVLRRYNENGTPSGEAKVIFVDHDAAKKAVETKRFHKIRERTIYLTLC